MFPSESTLLHHKEVIAFAYGLTNYPDDFIDVIYDKIITPITEFAADLPMELSRNRHEFRGGEYLLSTVRDHIAGERVETKTSTNAMRHRHVCVLRNTMKDFVPSRVYILEYSDGVCAGLIYQDPAFPSHDLQGPNRSDPTMYIINAHESALNFSMAVMKKLSECYDIRITKLYSENLHEIHDFIPPEGCLNLSTSPSKRWVSWTIITQIKEKKKFIENSKESFSESAVVCLEQFSDSVFLGSNMKSFEKSGYELPSPVIQHLAREFYGCDKSASPKGEGCCQGYSSATKDTKHSRVTILDISSALVSREEIKYLVEPVRLIHLRELHISSYCLDANFDDLDCNSLEELHLYSEVDWKSNEYLRMDTQIKDSHSALNQDPITHLSRVRLTKSLQKLRLISVWGVLTDKIVDLLRLELPSLRIDLRHLYYTDMKTLPEVISLLAPRLKLLYFYGNILTGQLGNLIGGASDQKHPCIFQCLEQLYFIFFDSGIAMGINALSAQVRCGTFPRLRRLGVTYMNRPIVKWKLFLKTWLGHVLTTMNMVACF